MHTMFGGMYGAIFDTLRYFWSRSIRGQKLQHHLTVKTLLLDQQQ